MAGDSEELTWPQVGMRARWMGPLIRTRLGNPPPPGAAIATNTAAASSARPSAPMGWRDCDIIEIAPHHDGQRAIVARLRTVDGIEFDPRIDPARVVPLVRVTSEEGP